MSENLNVAFLMPVCLLALRALTMPSLRACGSRSCHRAASASRVRVSGKPFITLAISLVMLVTVLSCADAGNPRPRASGGVIDLTGWDFERDGIVALDGEWEFYPDTLLAPEDVAAGTKPGPCLVTVPAAWNTYRVDGRTMRGEGFATYRLVVRTGYRGRLALSRLHPNTSFRLWVNGARLSSAGSVGATREASHPGQISRTVDFTGSGDANEIVIQVSNFSYHLGGIWDTVRLGTGDAIRAHHEAGIAYDLFLFGSLLIIGLYYLGFFAVRRKDRSFLWFGIISLILAARVLVTNHVFILTLVPGLDWELMVKLNFISFVLPVPLFITFIDSLFPGLLARRVNAAFTVLALLYVAAVAVTPARFYSAALTVVHAVIILSALYVIVVLIIAAIRKRPGATVVMAGFIVLFATIINDILMAAYIVHTIQLVPLGQFCLVLALSFNLSRSFASAFERVEELSENLEQKVRERTEELLVEKNLLKQRNEKFERELDLARRIQQQLIPEFSPVPYIHARYLPMGKIGGDFYDFILFRDTLDVGIFLSDVSGHGVPAAFVTSMIKTILLQSGERVRDPSALLTFLNEMLVNQTGGHFITALYCIYNPETRTLRYANAGHIPPYLVGARADALRGHRGLPLAAFSGLRQDDYDMAYRTNETRLDEGSRLVLCTDGLIEATNVRDRDLIQDDAALRAMLEEMRELPAGTLIERLLARIGDGTPPFEDDVCVICVDA